MTVLFLYDDERARQFEPFVLTRPVSELMAGAEVIRQRWERAAGVNASGFIAADHLAHFEEAGAPRCLRDDDVIPAGSLVANSRFVSTIGVELAAADGSDAETSAFQCEGEICAIRTNKEISVSDFRGGSVPLADFFRGEARSISGRWLSEVWDIVVTLVDQLTHDIAGISVSVPAGCGKDATVLGNFPVHCESGARIEPFVILDATAGPILIMSGATISSFSRIVGPCYIGENATVMGDAIRACSIGEHCKVRGEISNSVMLGFSNKGHTGFVGHSYLGRWVNLGAGTTTSNLKNTYGNVQVWTPSGMRDTGEQFLGTMFGDHVKTGIGTMLTTGTVLGAGANIYGRNTVPKYVPPFAWGDGDPYERYAMDKFVAVAGRMMARRHVTLSDDAAAQLVEAYNLTEGSGR